MEKDSTAKISRAYEYNKDGSLNYVEDLLNPVFDRLQQYDHQGRLAAAFSGLEARGGTVTDPEDQKTQLPYRQTYGFNAFDNLTSRTNLNWGTDYWAGVSFNQSLAHLNNRITESGYQYDADGRNTVSVDSEEVVSTFDAAGYLVRIQKSYTQAVPNPNDDVFRYLDANGREGKRLQKDWIEPEPESNYQWVDRPLRFFIRSTVMGGEVISEANETGQKLKTIVYAGGEAIAWQTFDQYGATVVFEHFDASRMTRRMTKPDGSTVLGTGIETSAAEFDALGQSIGIENPYPSMTPGGGEGCIGCGSSGIFGIDDNSTMHVNGQRVSMTLDGARISYSSGMSLLYVGASAVCPNNDCGPRRYQGTWTSPLVAGADGFLGYLAGSPQQTNRPRMSRGNKPTLKRAPKRTKADAEKANALAATGIFDNELIGDFSNVDPPKISDPDFGLNQALKLIRLLIDRVKPIGLTQDQQEMIGRRLVFALFSQACVDAFRTAQRPTPAEVLRDRGIVYAHYELLRSSSNNQLLGISESQRREVLDGEVLNSHGTTVTRWTGPVYTFFRDRSFKGGDYGIDENVVHETIHASGVGSHPWHPIPFLPFTYGHDLMDYPHYFDILEKCQMPSEP